ncbi:uncharacterized protein LOC131070565 isoform X2 [Cryptomeria japonica]|uniref:uncharacterized protein LOC131070565 isoform X2 n=1 Tax=Cryptomeria japonica TaxID=3369 RepID=UPI0027DA31D8|nr:uncharacterized protein LOC131070565 isoform X2 [Cryptomeria japonica]
MTSQSMEITRQQRDADISAEERAEEIDIGIVGGGLAGLALALALQERNIPCQVFESHPPSMSADTSSIVGVGLNGITALEGIKLGLTTALPQAGGYCTKIKRVTLIDTQVSDCSVQEFVPGELIILTWKSLHRVLDSFVDRSRISFSHRLLAYKACKGGVEAYFKCPKEGTEDHRIKVVPCKLLIGADGIWSTVRKQMVGDAPRYLKMRTWSTLVHDPHLKLFDGLGKGEFIMQTEKRTVTTFATSNAGDYTLWSLRKMDQTGDMANSVLVERTTRGRPGCKQRALQQLDGIELWDDLRNVIEATGEEIITERKIMDRLPLNKWSDADRHVLLIGDAAHAQFVGPGQGAMSAFEDVHQLSLLLEVASGSSFSEESIQDAVKRFEKLRIPRTKKMQEYASYSTMIPEFQPEWSQHLTAEDRLKVNEEYRKWIQAYPNKQQGDPDSIYFQ